MLQVMQEFGHQQYDYGCYVYHYSVDTVSSGTEERALARNTALEPLGTRMK